MTEWPGCRSFAVLVNVTKKAGIISFDSKEQFEPFFFFLSSCRGTGLRQEATAQGVIPASHGAARGLSD
jgi:hypothetical protein